jgi:phosphatidylinositol alpha-1,6-mannosyltransferase
MPGGAAIYSALKLLKKKIPYSIIVHGMEIIESKESLKKRIRHSLFFLKKRAFSHAHKCICISHYTQKKLLEQKLCSKEQTVVINNGVNPKTFRSAFSQQPHTSISLLTVSRLVPHKGIDQVLYALPRVLREFPNLTYSIAGSGPDKGRLQEIATKLVLNKHVQFLGKVSDSELTKLYSKADLFVLLSREEKQHVEGFGLVFLEAAACKTPSLGGNSGGIPDAILHDKTGWIVSPTDQQEIVAKLISILKQPQLLKQTGEEAYTYTLENRTWKKVTQQILNVTGVHE